MKIPKTVKIGAHTIKVEIKPLDRDCGYYEHKKGLIVIDADMPQSLQESTFIHEVIHVMNSTISEGTVGHALQDSLAEQLYQVLKENKFLK